MRKFIACLLCLGLLLTLSLGPASETFASAVDKTEETIVLRVCNWEEYIDEGGWDDDEVIDLENGDVFGENSVIEDFEEWYEEVYGVKVVVEYSCFGTNEELYNMLTIGDVYDLVCPSEYMFMKLIDEDMVQPLSDSFFDESDEYNYYWNGVSPYIKNIFETKEVNGEKWGKYAAGYMWGVTGIVYNPEVISKEEASTWTVLDNPDYYRQVTIKDNVRDSFFAAVGAVKHDLLTNEEFKNDPDYSQNLEDEMNDVSDENLQAVLEYLQSVRDNAYSFETDSGKADMITGKVVANYQWSGDAVYTMDQADEDDYTLNFAIPEESSNIYFDGWVMLKSGINGDSAKQQAAEAFINFLSRPDIVVRNMYYIGYTSVISGGDDDTIFNYLKWNYEAEDDEEDVTDYSVAYFFSEDDEDEDYVMTVPTEQLDRQLGAQYPSKDSISRTSIMVFFPSDVNDAINQMWINVRCYNITKTPVWIWVAAGVVLAAVIVLLVKRKMKKY